MTKTAKTLSPEPASWENPQHEHGLNTLAGYSVVLTDWTDGLPCQRYETVRFENAAEYGKALAAAAEAREVCGEKQHAVIDSLYTCGCRSDKIHGSIAEGRC